MAAAVNSSDSKLVSTTSAEACAENVSNILGETPQSSTNNDLDVVTSEEKQTEIVTSSKPTVSKRRQVCFFFNTRKGCLKGETCTFLHNKKSEEDANAKNDGPEKGEISEMLASCSIADQKQEKDVEETSNSMESKGKSDHSSSQRKLKESDTQNKKVPKEGKNKKVCYFYSRTKKCRFGEECKFAHVYKQKEKTSTPSKGAEYEPPVQTVPIDDDKPFTAKGNAQQVKSQSKKTWKKKMCRYYEWGCCFKGDRCTFWHPLDPMNPFADFENKLEPFRDTTGGEEGKLENNDSKPKHSMTPSKTSAVANQPNVMQRYILSELGENEVENMRKTELEQVKKRYPKAEESKEGMSDVFDFIYKMTDPDWPFDVSRMWLEVVFPKDYPLEQLKIAILENEDIPPAVQNFIERKASEWIETRFNALLNDDKIELMFRPFLKWLDRQLEEMFTEGLRQMKRDLVAKAAGLEFVTAEELQEQYKAKDINSSEGSDEQEEYDTDDEEYETVSEDEEENIPEIDPVKRGTEVKLKELQMKENIATLTATKLNVIVQCERCKFQTEIASPAERLNSVLCTRCSTEQFVTFRPSVVHQFSSTLGYLDLVDCAAFDIILMDCKFNITCLGCNKEGQMDGIMPGQPKDMWCRHCHGKQTISTEGVRFQLLQPAGQIDTDKAHVVGVKKQRKLQKDPSIKLGSPLPDNGICKHYRKSYRWFRFPCCGKTYPCDICHDMNEMDHEMKYANRVICGHCCKEQSYSAERPCTGCGMSMTKKASSHWEGGKGCRDKTKMSRNESRKYASANKTVSRKAIEKQQKGKKKRTNSGGKS